MERIEDMAAREAEEHIAALYGDELYGLELDGEVSGEGAMRCRYAPVHDEVRGICDALGLDYDRIATDRAGMLWAGEDSGFQTEDHGYYGRLRGSCHQRSRPHSRKSV